MMEKLTDEFQLMNHKLIATLVESVLHPGTFIWMWQTVEGAIMEKFDMHGEKL